MGHKRGVTGTPGPPNYALQSRNRITSASWSWVQVWIEAFAKRPMRNNQNALLRTFQEGDGLCLLAIKASYTLMREKTLSNWKQEGNWSFSLSIGPFLVPSQFKSVTLLQDGNDFVTCSATGIPLSTFATGTFFSTLVNVSQCITY